MKKIIIFIFIFLLIIVCFERVNATTDVYDYLTVADSLRPKTPNIDFDSSYSSCKEVLGPNLTSVVRASIKILQIVGAIVAIVKGMILLLPAVIAKDADGLKKASKPLVSMAIILAIIFLLPYIVRFIGHIFDFDLSCFF